MNEVRNDILLPQYRSLDSSALVAGCLALLSLLALVTPLLLFIPLITLFVALFAWHKIAANRQSLVGIPLAVLALFVATSLLCYVPLRMYLRGQVLSQHALVLSDKALALLQAGQLAELHHLTSRSFVEADPHKPLAEHYAASHTHTESLNLFKKGMALQKILDLKEFNYQREMYYRYMSDAASDGFVVRYGIQPGDASERPFRLWISVERTKDASGKPIWWLRGLHLEDPHAAK